MTDTTSTTQTKKPPTGLTRTIYDWGTSLKSPTPYLMTFGIFLWIGAYYLFVEGWELPRFNKLPGPVEVITEFLNPDPVGTGPFTEILRFDNQIWELGKNKNYWQRGNPMLKNLCSQLSQAMNK